MNIAVTGAQGFVGKATVMTLKKAGHTVLPIVRSNDGTYSNAYEWDITEQANKKFPDIDAIVHIAALVDDWATYEKSRQVNVIGTQHVVDAFPNVKTFVYISSASVYDPTNEAQQLNEESPAGTNLLNAYGQTKYEGEQIVLKADIPSRIVLRPHIIYGPGDKTVLPRLLKAQKLGRFLVLGDGQNHISLTHIQNLTSAILLAVSKEDLGGEIFNVVDKKSVTVEEVINALKTELGITAKNTYIPKPAALFIGSSLEKTYRFVGVKKSPLITPYLVEQMTSDHVLAIDKAGRMLNYKPTVDYLSGFKEL